MQGPCGDKAKCRKRSNTGTNESPSYRLNSCSLHFKSTKFPARTLCEDDPDTLTVEDFNLQAYQERLGLVNFLDAQGLLAKCPPAELDKVANYLLYAEDVDAEVELKEGSKKKVSYESLIETTLGESLPQVKKQFPKK